jgi:hypothetical protein
VSTYKIDKLTQDTDYFIQRFDRENPDIANQISKKRSGFWWRLANAAAADYLKKYGDYDPADNSAVWRRWLKAEFPDVPTYACGGLTPEQAGKLLEKRILNEPDEPGIFERMTDFLAKRRKAVTALSLLGLGAAITGANAVDAGDPSENLNFVAHYIAADHKGKTEISEVGEGCSSAHFDKPTDHYFVRFYGIVENKKPEKWGEYGGVLIRIKDARFPDMGYCWTNPIDGKYDERLELVTAEFNYYYDPSICGEGKLDIIPFLPIFDASYNWIDFEKFNHTINIKDLPNLSAPVPKEFRTDPKSPSVIDELKDNLGLLTAIGAPSVVMPIVMYYWLRKKNSAS